MKNLLSIVDDVVSGDVLSAISNVIGSNESATSSAISKLAPAIIGGLIQKGGTTSGAQSLIDNFKSNSYGERQVSDLMGMFGNKSKTSNFLDMGSNILGMLFGGNQSSILDKVIGMTSLGKSAGGTLLKFLAPVIVNKLSGLIFKNNLTAQKLVNYLTGQKSSVLGAVPGLSNILGFSADRSTSTSTSHNHTSSTGGSNGGGFLKWLLPLLLLGGLAWFLMKGCNNKTATTDDHKVETTKVTTTDHTNTKVKDMPSTTSTTPSTTTTTAPAKIKTLDYTKFRFVANGDILDQDGVVIYKNGEYALDANGNLIDLDGRILVPMASIPTTWKTNLKSQLGEYAGVKLVLDDQGNLVDPNGKIILKKGEFQEKDGYYYDKNGNKLGRIWSKIIKAIGDGAKKTVDGMKNLFTGMFRKAPGAKKTYTLSQIEFNKENHRITNFSKAEVEGLAAALKANKDSKIDVNVYTNDGKDNGENKKLSKVRAEVVKNMLVTLGVDKGQISFNGKGSSDDAKASSDKVEITVK